MSCRYNQIKVDMASKFGGTKDSNKYYNDIEVEAKQNSQEFKKDKRMKLKEFAYSMGGVLFV